MHILLNNNTGTTMQDNKIIWLEGMFLQPQHFQQHDRYFENLIHLKTSAIEKNCWGFSELQIDIQLLSIGKVGLTTAIGFFQDGTAINIPQQDLALNLAVEY